MCVALLTYADLSARLNISREAARALARRRRLPRSRSEDGKALVSVDLSELRYTPRPRRARRADPLDASMAKSRHWSHFRSDEIGTGLQIPVLTRFPCANRYPLRSKTLWRPKHSRRRSRGSKPSQPAPGQCSSASASAPIAWPSSCCRRRRDGGSQCVGGTTGRRSGGLTDRSPGWRPTAGQAARRLGHLAAAIVGADRAARR